MVSASMGSAGASASVSVVLGFQSFNLLCHFLYIIA